MSGARRRFTPEYRAEAGRLVVGTGRPIAVVARELGLGGAVVGRCVNAERQRSEEEPTGELGLYERAELGRLRREVSWLKLDNEFLGYPDIRIMPMYS